MQTSPDLTATSPREERILWHEDVSPAPAGATGLPARIDVAVIGAGYTGLSCALELARAGHSVAVFEARAIGHGCSSRNAGMVGPSFHKLGMAGLTARYGEAQAVAILREGLTALDHFEAFVRAEGIDCDLAMTGRFRGARTVADYDAMAREGERLGRALGLPSEMVPRAAQRDEIGSDFYRGGIVYPRDGGIQPRKLMLGLAARVAEAGVLLFPDCPAIARPDGKGGGRVETPKGTITAEQIVLATNAWSDGRTKPLARRVIPIRTGAAATAPLPPALMAQLSPKGRMFGESGRIFMWFRPSACGRRMVFGGRMGGGSASPAQRMAAIRAQALRVFPELAATPFTHVWSGEVAYTPDHAPHLGFFDGVWMAGGYCGSGVTRSLRYGHLLATRMLGRPGSETALDAAGFPTVPFRPVAAMAARVVSRWHERQDARDLLRRPD